ncbi:hypothetical protein M231_05550 [Tremella mesenterica]|uniref:Uncharacterized protein n=1 Tax=Tremella mesenterica TaxID=5217 RepID=A0A4Q1BHT3_TREME|nr:hypothetical protein M231_05550 [Tremella mesenterica]
MSFHPLRQTLRATLIAGLLVFGHVLLGSAASAPRNIVLPLASNLRTTSALIFLTLLWQSFTLLELVDARHTADRFNGEFGMNHIGRDEGRVFGTTAVEFIHNSVLLGAWAAWSTTALDSFSALSMASSLNLELVFLPATATIILISVLLLQTQLVLSIARHAYTHGGIFTSDFWRGRTGWWTERVRLDVENIPSETPTLSVVQVEVPEKLISP